MRRAVERAKQMLTSRRHHLDLIAERLLETDTIDRPTLDRLVADAPAAQLAS